MNRELSVQRWRAPAYTFNNRTELTSIRVSKQQMNGR